MLRVRHTAMFPAFGSGVTHSGACAATQASYTGFAVYLLPKAACVGGPNTFPHLLLSTALIAHTFWNEIRIIRNGWHAGGRTYICSTRVRTYGHRARALHKGWELNRGSNKNIKRYLDRLHSNASALRKKITICAKISSIDPPLIQSIRGASGDLPHGLINSYTTPTRYPRPRTQSLFL